MIALIARGSTSTPFFLSTAQKASTKSLSCWSIDGTPKEPMTYSGGAGGGGGGERTGGDGGGDTGGGSGGGVLGFRGRTRAPRGLLLIVAAPDHAPIVQEAGVIEALGGAPADIRHDLIPTEVILRK